LRGTIQNRQILKYLVWSCDGSKHAYRFTLKTHTFQYISFWTIARYNWRNANRNNLTLPKLISVTWKGFRGASGIEGPFWLWFERVETKSVTSHLNIWSWSKETPPPRSIYYVPWSRDVCKTFHDEMQLSHHVVKSLTDGSWSGNIVDSKPPQGGGVLSIKLSWRLLNSSRKVPKWNQLCEL